MTDIPGLPKFFKRGESAHERALRERIEKLEARVAQLDADDCEIDERLSKSIAEVRAIALNGSIESKPPADAPAETGRQVFTQRRAKALERASAPQAMAERIAAVAPAPPDAKEE